MRKVKVSVVIPIYNVENYLEACLSSIVNQTFKDIEIICINDGSTDKSKNILNRYAKKDNRVIMINKKNEGLSIARNIGIDKATGEYIMFVDSDDYLDLHTIENLYNIVKRNDLDTLFFCAETFYEDINPDEYKEHYLLKGEYPEVKSGQELFCDMRKNGDFFSNACLQINRLSFLKKNNIRFIEGIIHEDEPFTLNVTLVSKRAMKISNQYYKRRIRKGSIMTSMNSEMNCVKSSYGCFKGLMNIIPKIELYVDKEKILNNYKSYLNFLRNASARKIKNIEGGYQYFKICENKEDYLFYNYIIMEYTAQLKKIERLNQEISNLKQTGRLKKLWKTLKRKLKRIWILYFSNLYVSGPQVSIIMTIYNSELYLDEALESLKNQSLKNLEIICVDDGSTDHSMEILNRYANKDSRFKIFQKEHTNAGDSRNFGLEKARGEYLLFLDSDDIFDRNLCKTTYYHAKLNKLEILLFGSNKLLMQTKEIVPRNEPIFGTRIVPNRVYSSKELSRFLFQICAGNAWSKLYNRKFIKNNQLKFQSLSSTNDAYFTRTTFTKANRIMAIKNKLVTYRSDLSSSITSNRDNNPLCFYEACLEIKKYLEKEEIWKDYERSFRNMVICEFIWQYSTLKTERAKQLLKNKFKKEGVKKLGLEDITCIDIDFHEQYGEFIQIINK